jgi:N-acetylglucosamine kinase-like BadF-type ATPase
MFIIIESGSTKADWVAISGKDQYTFFTTDGINPATQVELLDLANYGELMQHINDAESIYFYGAGINDAVSTQRITDWFRGYGFSGKLFVAEDLIAAARACFGDNTGIVCILGTGSNSCVYSQGKVLECVPTLGYIFNDEGGGTQIGKEVLKAYFCKTMPDNERNVFEANYPVTKEEVVEKVYRSSGANKYVASFAPFLMMIEGEWKEKLLDKVFRDFIELRILRYKDHKILPIKFVGSIAFYHRMYLEKAMSSYGLKVDEIVQKPIQKLIEYHLNHKL